MSLGDALAAPLNRIAFGLAGSLAAPRLSILMFHRVHRQPDLLIPAETTAARFDRLMALLAKSFRVMTVGQAAAALAAGDLPPRGLVITFDDGYADNVDVALPILQRHGLRATFFVSTGFLDGGRMWNDSIIECIRLCPLEEIDLTVLGLARYPLVGIEDRQNCIAMLLEKIKYLDTSRRQSAVDSLQRATRVQSLPSDLMMRSNQVRAMHEAGMEIGAHTVHHPILTSLSPGDAELEISAGRQRLQEIVDAPVDVIAYPNGKPHRDYDRSHVEMVRRLGFRAAVSTEPGVSRAGADLFQLPRFTPWDRSLLKWSARLLINHRRTVFDMV